MSTTRIPLTPRITFIDPTTKRECKVFKHPFYDTDIINFFLSSKLYLGSFGNKKAEAELTARKEGEFFLRHSKEVEDFVFCCKIKAWNPAGGFLSRGAWGYMRINLGHILMNSPGGVFNPTTYNAMVSSWTKPNTRLDTTHHAAIQSMLNLLPAELVLSLCPPSATGFSRVVAENFIPSAAAASAPASSNQAPGVTYSSTSSSSLVQQTLNAASSSPASAAASTTAAKSAPVNGVPAAAANFGYAGADNSVSEQDASFLQMLLGLAEAKAASSQQANSEEVVNLQDMDELNISLPSP